jgi:hypothetical protein
MAYEAMLWVHALSLYVKPDSSLLPEYFNQVIFKKFMEKKKALLRLREHWRVYAFGLGINEDLIESLGDGETFLAYVAQNSTLVVKLEKILSEATSLDSFLKTAIQKNSLSGNWELIAPESKGSLLKLLSSDYIPVFRLLSQEAPEFLDRPCFGGFAPQCLQVLVSRGLLPRVLNILNEIGTGSLEINPAKNLMSWDKGSGRVRATPWNRVVWRIWTQSSWRKLSFLLGASVKERELFQSSSDFFDWIENQRSPERVDRFNEFLLEWPEQGWCF